MKAVRLSVKVLRKRLARNDNSYTGQFLSTVLATVPASAQM